MPELTGTRDIRGYLAVLWRWKFVFLFFLVAAPIVVYLIERSQPRTYESSALVGVNQTSVSSSALNGGGSFSTSNVTAVAELVTTTPVADVAASLFHPPADPNQIRGEVTASGDTTTNFVTITAEDRNPHRAAAVANAFAHAIGSSQQGAAAAQVNASIRSIRAQLAHTGRNNPARAQLSAQLTQLQTARAEVGGAATVLQPATPASAPVGLNTRRALELGLLIGLLLGLGAVVLAENADRRLRSPLDLEDMTELPLLATIAETAFSSNLNGGGSDDEAFHMLRASLTYFKLEGNGTSAAGGVRSILITSPGEQEGKTTVAIRLAIVSAKAGQRVILIDADLRRAAVQRRLGIEPEAGLSAVLQGERSLTEALAAYPVDGAGSLMVLPAGSPSRTPAALIESKAMRQVLADAESQSDLVIIDSPAALAVSDPVPLMEPVSGVLLVARMHRSTRGAVRRLQKLVQAAGAIPLGVVATGLSTALGYEQRYYGYYAPRYSRYYAKNGADKQGRRQKAPKAGAGQ